MYFFLFFKYITETEKLFLSINYTSPKNSTFLFLFYNFFTLFIFFIIFTEMYFFLFLRKITETEKLFLSINYISPKIVHFLKKNKKL